MLARRKEKTHTQDGTCGDGNKRNEGEGVRLKVEKITNKART
jgi:hypothetical protein